MKTKANSSAILARSRETAMALALGLALAIPSVGVIGAGIIHAQAAQPQTPVAATVQQAAQPDFTCHASPGGWCDLRDWRGFADAYAQPKTQPTTH